MNILISLLVLVFLVLAATVISRITSITKSMDKQKEDANGLHVDSFNGINGKLMLGFFVVGIILAVWSYFVFEDRMNLPVASEHGVLTDKMFWIEMAMATAGFFVTNAFLFYFAFKYRFDPKRKATFYADNHTLEKIWTGAPAVLMVGTILFGWQIWSDITAQEPKDSVVIEITGKQFGWYARYGGIDNSKLGNYNYKLIVDGKNEVGIDMTDENSYDDFMSNELHIPKGRPVLLKIRARDVLHSVFLPHLRVKMDAVPGMPTKFWFIPTKSTAEMRAETGNPEFNYLLTCTEICGRGHFGMKMPVVVDEEEDYKAWVAKQATWISQNKEFLALVPNAFLPKAMKYAGVTEADLAGLGINPNASAQAPATEAAILPIKNAVTLDVKGLKLNVAADGIESKVMSFITGNTPLDEKTWFNFDRLLFETGKSTLKSESQEQLKNIVEILKAYPNVNIKLGGYTDNVGHAANNLKLSDDRAKSVMTELVKMGIDKTRLAAEGYGQEHPVADNATEEGRSQNRRISIKVTKK
jgi:cytochrome c oxidase subunit II